MNGIHLSEGEWKIMKLLWESPPRTIAQLVASLEAETGWSRTTVFVMLKRLIAKGAVRVDDSGRVQQYYPTVTRARVAAEAADSFLARVYDGSIGWMVSSLTGRRALSAEEIAELRRVLDEAEKKNGG